MMTTLSFNVRRRFKFLNRIGQPIDMPKSITNSLPKNIAKSASRLRLCLCLLFLLTLTFAGCPQPKPIVEDDAEIEVAPPDPLTLLVIDDDKLGDIIARQWAARRDGKLTILNRTSAEFAEQNFAISSFQPSVDVVLYPIGTLGELESRKQLLTVPRAIWSSEEVNKNEFLRLHRNTLVRHGNEIWGVPLGCPQFTLMYNQKLLQQQELKLPATWEKLVAMVDGHLELPLAEKWAVQVFLARVGPSIRSRGTLSTVFERNTMQPLIADPPFVEAMQDLRTIVGENRSQLEFTPEQVFTRVVNGETLIGMTWPSRSFGVSADAKTDQESEFGFAQLPGTEQWFNGKVGKWVQRIGGDPTQVDLIGFSGMLGSVAASGRNTETSFEFLQWLSSKSIALVTVIESPLSGPFRASHLGDPERWTGDLILENSAQQYADVVQRINDEDVVFMFPRIPGRERYLAILDLQIRKCLTDEIEPAAALAVVAKEWDAITDDLGRQKQIGELRKDAGL